MIEKVVGYLRSNGVAFRLASYPAPEPLPAIAHPLPPGGRFVETKVLLVAGRPTIAVIPPGATLELAGLMNELGVEVLEGSPADLPEPFSREPGPVPPLGGLLKVPVFVEERLITSSVLSFRAFSNADFVDVVYDDFARIEVPRVSMFSVGGELPETGQPEEIEELTEEAGEAPQKRVA